MNTKQTVTKCPNCGFSNIAKVIAKKRWNLCICHNCEWKSEPFQPETKEVSSFVEITSLDRSGWNYKIFDGYGQIHTVSAGFGNNEEQAINELRKRLSDLNRPREESIGGPFKGVLYFVPSQLIIQGQIVYDTIRKV